MKIIVNDFNIDYNPELYSLLKYYQFFSPDSVQIKTTDVVMVSGAPDKFVPVHFTIGDKKIYRLEEDINSFVARGSFNDTTYCSGLIDVFEKLFDSIPDQIMLAA